MRPVLDALAPGLAVFMVFLGASHLLNGDAFGAPSRLPWAIFQWNEYRHPAQLYEILLAVGILLVILKHPFGEPGTGLNFWAAIALSAALLDRRAARREGRAPDGRPLRGLLVAAAVAVAVLTGCYAAAMRSMSRGDAESAVRMFLESRGAPAGTVERVAALSAWFPPAGHYAAGLAGVESQNRTGGGVNFLRGRLSTDGFWDYFFVAFGVKSSVGFLVVLSAGLLALALGRTRLDLTIAALLFPALYLFASGMATTYNIGFRHMLPAVPLK